MLPYTGLTRLSLLHRLDDLHSAQSHEDTRALRAALRWVLKNFRSSISELLGPMFFLLPRDAGTRGAPGAILHQEVGARAHGTCVGPGAVLTR
jgi:hypothetical protein